MLCSFDIKFKCLKDTRFQYDTDGSGQIEFPEFCNMMSAKMGTVNDEDMIRMAFRVLDKDGRGTIKSSAFKHLMTHIGQFNMLWLMVVCIFKMQSDYVMFFSSHRVYLWITRSFLALQVL